MNTKLLVAMVLAGSALLGAQSAHAQGNPPLPPGCSRRRQT